MNGRQWIERYPAVHAINRGYVTESVAVPIPIIMAALAGAMTVSWEERPQSLTLLRNRLAEGVDSPER
jgi:hypothetical protein